MDKTQFHNAKISFSDKTGLSADTNMEIFIQYLQLLEFAKTNTQLANMNSKLSVIENMLITISQKK